MIGCANCGVPIPEKVCPVCGHVHGPFADGGPLDLGIVRDDSLDRRNDLTMFMEEWVSLQALTNPDNELRLPDLS